MGCYQRFGEATILGGEQSLPLGVTGNTPDSGSGESWFEPRRGNFEGPPGDRRRPFFVAPLRLSALLRFDRLALRARLIYDAHHMSAATAGRTAPSRKEVTHERIVAAAARATRRTGYDGTGVAEIMKEVGLTHGGFYAHFASPAGNVADGADRAGAESVATLTRVAAAAPPQEALPAMIPAHLSKEHVDGVETGCPVAALGSETPRQAPKVRRAATRRIKEMIDVVARHSPDHGDPGVYKRALVTVATLVGALVLARAVDDPKLSKALREASLKHLDPTGT